MTKVIDLDHAAAREFFLRADKYCKFELPLYLDFGPQLKAMATSLKGKKFKECLGTTKPRDIETLNILLINNKDGRFAWRPLRLIHPAMYVFLMDIITEEGNWKILQARFMEFGENTRIECHSLPVVGEENPNGEKTQIIEWWQKIEQRSISLALEYSQLLHLDITDCYGAIYTHSIAWAIHTKETAKKERTNNDLVGNRIDCILQDMSHGQTNGIPQGSVLMDFIAEIVLGYGDSLVSEALEKLGSVEYRILRYRDDYRIFTNDSDLAAKIGKELSEVLSNLNFKINPTKTHLTSDVVLGSLKPDKVHWIFHRRKTKNLQQWLIQLTVLGKAYPNSGSLYMETKRLFEWLRRKIDSDKEYKLMNIQPQISILVNLAFENPRLFPLVTSALGEFVSMLESKEEQSDILRKIEEKFKRLPNTDYFFVWLQRLFLPVNPRFSNGGRICEHVINPSQPLWDSSWLGSKYRKLMESTPIVNQNVKGKLELSFSEEERSAISDSDPSNFQSGN
jgi:RNA-directed DNA polymerase